jgi:hypothetical protein
MPNCDAHHVKAIEISSSPLAPAAVNGTSWILRPWRSPGCIRKMFAFGVKQALEAGAEQEAM